MSDHYVLDADGKTPRKADLMEWATSFESRKAGRVGNDTLPNGVRVSTVWLGLNHQWGDGPPILWETMIFGGPHDAYQERYSSHADAVAGHAKAVALASPPSVVPQPTPEAPQ